MKVLLYEDTNAYSNAVAEANRQKAPIQAALVAYAALGLAAQPTAADLDDLYYNPKVFLERILTGNNAVTVGNGLSIEAGKVYDLLQKPAGTAAFLAKINDLQFPKGSWQPVRPNTRAYDLNNGVLTVKQAVLDQMLEGARIYATTQQQVDEWAHLQTIATALNALWQTGRFGNSWKGAEYLEKALVGKGLADAFNAMRPDPAYVVLSNR